MSLTTSQRSDIIAYAKRRRAALVDEYIQERWMGCENKGLQKKFALLNLLIYVLDKTNPTSFLTDAELDLLYDRIKCVAMYDFAKAETTDKYPWLLWDSIDWDAYEGSYWELP